MRMKEIVKRILDWLCESRCLDESRKAWKAGYGIGYRDGKDGVYFYFTPPPPRKK